MWLYFALFKKDFEWRIEKNTIVKDMLSSQQ